MATTVPQGSPRGRLRKAPDSGVHPALPRVEKTARTKAQPSAKGQQRSGRSTRSRG